MITGYLKAGAGVTRETQKWRHASGIMRKSDVVNQFWSDEIANLFILTSMIKHNRIIFESDKELAFLVHTPDVNIWFIMSP